LVWAGNQFRLQWGRLLGLYLVWYGIGRAFLETLRLDPAELVLGIRVNIWGAFAAIALGLVIMAVQGRRHPGNERGPYRVGREWSAEPALESEDEYYVVDDGAIENDEGEVGSATSQKTSSPQG